MPVAFWTPHEVENVCGECSKWIEQSQYEGQLNTSGLPSMKKWVQTGYDRRLWSYECRTQAHRAFLSLTLQLFMAKIIEGWDGVLGKYHYLLPLIWWLSVTVTNTGKILARWTFSPSYYGCSCSYVDRLSYVRGWTTMLSSWLTELKQKHKVSCSVGNRMGCGEEKKNNCSKEKTVTIYNVSC